MIANGLVTPAIYATIAIMWIACTISYIVIAIVGPDRSTNVPTVQPITHTIAIVE